MFGNQTFLWLLEMVFLLECSTITLQITDRAGFSPESKSMHTIFHKKVEKRAKYLKMCVRNVQILKIF